MLASMETPPNDAPLGEPVPPAYTEHDLEQVEVRFKLPRYLRRELIAAAKAQTISTASLLRIISLEFVRARHRKG